tara:strand:+ start:2866 stop:3375 length:510 start_codon:yes stop_codon:yes gene_type:complete
MDNQTLTAKQRKQGNLSLRMEHVKAIIQHVAAVYGVTPRDIWGRRRFDTIAEARQMVMYILLKRGATSTRAGQLLKRDHGTVIHARKKIREYLTWCKPTQLAWNRLRHLADPEHTFDPVAKYTVRVNCDMEFLSDAQLNRDEIETKAIARIVAGRACPTLVHHDMESVV